MYFVQICLLSDSLRSRMFHNFTFFEIKNAWRLIRSDLGHNEETKNFFSITRCFEGVPPPQSLIFLDAENFFDKCDIFLTKQDRE